MEKDAEIAALRVDNDAKISALHVDMDAKIAVRVSSLRMEKDALCARMESEIAALREQLSLQV